MNLFQLSAGEICDKTVSGELDPVTTAERFLGNALSSVDKYNNFISFTPELALESARAVRDSIAAGNDPGMLAGVPLAIKDNICVRGYRTTCASRILDSFVSAYSATVVDRLRQAGALIIGKTNQDEFGMGSSNENSYYGPVRNPHDIDYSPGGSSGGSAATVASFQVPLALGSDTGGSIRQPAALTGIVGLKPTYGTVSRYGLVAFGSSLDQIGPLARNVSDVARLLQVISYYDPDDSTSADYQRPDFMAGINRFEPLKVGVPEEYFGEGLEDDVRHSVERSVDLLRSLGCEIVEISLPHTDKAIAAYYVIATAEASSNLARYDGVRYGHRSDASSSLYEMYANTRSEGFGDEVKRRIMLGTYALSAGYYEAYYQKAMQVREVLKRDMLAAFEDVDVIVTPTSPVAGIKLGEKIADPLSMYLMDVYTVTANLVGTGAISIPCGYNDRGLPIGLQITGRPFDESTILRAACRLESELGLEIGVGDRDG